jgi:hypothetical protein
MVVAWAGRSLFNIWSSHLTGVSEKLGYWLSAVSRVLKWPRHTRLGSRVGCSTLASPSNSDLQILIQHIVTLFPSWGHFCRLDSIFIISLHWTPCSDNSACVLLSVFIQLKKTYLTLCIIFNAHIALCVSAIQYTYCALCPYYSIHIAPCVHTIQYTYCTLCVYYSIHVLYLVYLLFNKHIAPACIIFDTHIASVFVQLCPRVTPF